MANLTKARMRAGADATAQRRPSRWPGVLLWVLAVLLMAGSAAYQRMTGPTHPKRGSFTVAGETYRYKLIRTAFTGADALVSIPDPGPEAGATLYYKRYPTADDYTALPMERKHYDASRESLLFLTFDVAARDDLEAYLTHEPMAGKLAYYIELTTPSGTEILQNGERPVIMRFKGFTHPAILVPHIVLMFLGMLWGLRTLLEALAGRPGVRVLAWTTLALIFVGGLIFGPLVQHYAFGAAWTGVPFAWDLTDNKTLVMFLCWLVAVLALGRQPGSVKPLARWITVAAAVVMIVVYLIPHSMYGSELDYGRVDEGVDPSEAIRQG